MAFRSLSKSQTKIFLTLLIAFPIAIVVDAVDYIPPAYLTPGLLQAVDIIAVFVLLPILGPISFIGFGDLIPLLGMWPTFTTLVAIRILIFLFTRR